MCETLCQYATDAAGGLVYVDGAWCDFARDNGAAEYAEPDRLYGRPLLSFISEMTTRHVYSILMDRVVKDRLTIAVPFRCDAPTQRRWLELQMSPREQGGVHFRTRQFRTEPRPAPIAFDRPQTRTDVILRMCSWCKDVEIAPAQWAPVEDAVRRFQVFASTDVPLITHGICPDCVALFERDARR